MVTKIQKTEIELEGVSITVEKKRIKNLYLKVVPPDGKIMISAPVRMKEEVIRAFAFSKITWIKKQREKCLNEWYREQLKREIPLLVSKWENILKVDVKEWGVKNMKTRWGTCNVNARRIWLNLQLAKKSPKCLEYVVVHEMVHLLEASHNQRFYGFMDKFLPNWRETRAELNGRKKEELK